MLDIASEAETYNLLTLLAVGEKDLCCYCIQLLLWWGRVQKNLVSGENILDIGQILWQLDSPTLRMKTGGADSSRLILSWSAGRMQTDPQVGIKRAVDQDSNSDCQPLNVSCWGERYWSGLTRMELASICFSFPPFPSHSHWQVWFQENTNSASFPFLAVHNSSIGLIVCPLVGHH